MLEPLQQRQRSVSRSSTSSLGSSINSNIASQCLLSQKCKSLSRIQTELHFYECIIKDDENDYDSLLKRNIPQIINDYHHILNYHLNVYTASNDTEFAFIYNKIAKYIKCNIKNCNKYTRHIQRNIVHNNIQITFCVDLLDMIHTHLLHSYDIGIRIKEYKKQSISTNDTDQCLLLHQGGRLRLNAKRYITHFADEKVQMSSTQDITETNDSSSSISSLPDLSQQPNIKTCSSNDTNDTNHKSSSDATFEFSHKTCNSSFPFSLQNSTFSSNNSSPKEASKYIRKNSETKSEETTVNTSVNNTKKSYMFGMTYYYWPYFKNNHDLDPYNPGCKYSDFYIPKPKYKHLKEELLHIISKQEYDTAIYKTNQYLKHSNDLKSIRSTDYPEYNIEADLVLFPWNLLALIVYTDYDHISCELKKTLMKPQSLKEVKSLKAKHRHFWNWSKILKETVHSYGTQYNGNNNNNNKQNVLYHGCNNKIIFNKFNVYFCGITSFTPYKFIKPYINGMLLEIKHFNLKYFNCNMVSHYGYENEMVFFGGNGFMRLHNLYLNNIDMDCDIDANFKGFFQEMTIFDNTLSGKYDIGAIGYKFNILSELITFHCKTKYNKTTFQRKFAMHELEENKEDEKNDDNMNNMNDELYEYDPYTMDMFESFCKRKQKIQFNVIYLYLAYPQLMQYFISPQKSNIISLIRIIEIFKQIHVITIDYSIKRNWSLLFKNNDKTFNNFNISQQQIDNDAIILILNMLQTIGENNKYNKLSKITLLSIFCAEYETFEENYGPLFNKLDWNIKIEKERIRGDVIYIDVSISKIQSKQEKKGIFGKLKSLMMTNKTLKKTKIKNT